MLHNHKINLEKPKTIKIMERSIFSAHKVFNKCLINNHSIERLEYDILNQWFTYLTKENNIKIDLIIYVKTRPEFCKSRIQNRGRLEKKGVTIDYLEQLDTLYEEWLGSEKSSLIKVFNNETVNEFKLETDKIINYLSDLKML